MQRLVKEAPQDESVAAEAAGEMPRNLRDVWIRLYKAGSLVYFTQAQAPFQAPSTNFNTKVQI